MKMILFCIFIFFFLISAESFSKIEDPKVWNNIFNSCVPSATKGPNGLTPVDAKVYCECIANNGTNEFTLEELILLESQLDTLNEDERLSLMLLNKKTKNMVNNCLNKI